MRQFNMIVETVILITQTKRLVPFDSVIFPVLVPFHFFSWTNEKLHFHLFEFAHAKNKLTSNNFISEGFTNLGNPKGNLHSSCFLYVQEIYENTLRRFWTQINYRSIARNRTHLRREHQVELSNFCPVFRT